MVQKSFLYLLSTDNYDLLVQLCTTDQQLWPSRRYTQVLEAREKQNIRGHISIAMNTRALMSVFAETKNGSLS